VQHVVQLSDLTAGCQRVTNTRSCNSAQTRLGIRNPLQTRGPRPPHLIHLAWRPCYLHTTSEPSQPFRARVCTTASSALPTESGQDCQSQFVKARVHARSLACVAVGLHHSFLNLVPRRWSLARRGCRHVLVLVTPSGLFLRRSVRTYTSRHVFRTVLARRRACQARPGTRDGAATTSSAHTPPA
jgi:hypothetical protein